MRRGAYLARANAAGARLPDGESVARRAFFDIRAAVTLLRGRGGFNARAIRGAESDFESARNLRLGVPLFFASLPPRLFARGRLKLNYRIMKGNSFGRN